MTENCSSAVRRCLFLFSVSLLSSPVLAQPKGAKPVVISAQQYRARLAAAAHAMAALEKHPPRPLGKVLTRLDTSLTVRRADGAMQTVTGNQWSRLNADLIKPQNARREDVTEARRIAQNQIAALDEWTQHPLPDVGAGKIVAGLVASGQIRVSPPWWQSALANAWKAVANAWSRFWKWIFSLLPSSPAPRNVPRVDDRWLWGLFYFVVAAILASVGWFLFRAFGGSWSWRRRQTRRIAELEGEDAQLLLLPPDELRMRAEDFAAQGQFREALRHRYLALLLQLDARGVWRYDARRTNWEHIAGLRRHASQSGLVPALSDLTRRFDRVRYGGALCDAAGWNTFRDDALHLENQTKTGAEPALAGAAR